MTQTAASTPEARRAAAPGVGGAAPFTASGAPSGPLTPGAVAGSSGPLPEAIMRVRLAVRASLAGTPGRLRLFSALAIVLSIAFGLAAAQSFRSESEALDRAGANARQLVRVQAIHTALVQADANATNGFLVGGIEPPADRTQYLASIADASRLVAEAARAQPADGAALAALNAELVTYAGLVEQARADNRQGLPIGATYLSGASTGLRSDAIPILNNLVAANQARTTAEFDATGVAELWVVIFGVLAVAGLLTILVWLARRTHRLVNTPLACAAVIILVTGLLAMLSMSSLASQVRSVRQHSYAVTLAAADARIAGFDAKSNESLALIARGSGARFEQAWQTSADQVVSQARVIDGLLGTGSDLAGTWTPYAATHRSILGLDHSNQHTKAVALATGTSPSSANARFEAFDAASARVLTTASQKTAAQLSSHGWLILLGVLALLMGLVAAGFAWSGIAVRLDEYR